MSTDRPGQNGYLAAKARAEELGSTLDLLSYGGPEVSMRRLHRIIASRGILGLVIAPHSTPLIELDLNWSEFSIVCAGFSIKAPRFDRVGFDHYEAMVDVCERSWQRGYRRLALVMTSDNDARVMHLARAAFLRWESDHIHDREPPVLVMARDQPEVVRSWYERLRPDCILLYGRVKWLLEAGIPVGREVAVVTPLMSEHQRELGGYNIQLGNIATTSVDMLLAKISRNERGLPAMRQTLLIQAPWVEGLAAFTPAPKGRSPIEVSGQSEGRKGKAS